MTPRIVTTTLSLLLLALAAAPIQARTTDELPTAINPQPLPPRHEGAAVRLAINPQPLPPRRDGVSKQDPWPAPYIGETEKNRG